MQLDKIFKNNEKWIANKLLLDEHYFEKLAVNQKPEILYIGCSDSRVSAEDLMGLKPGEVFVHRNVANIVNNIDINVKSCITYAVKYLKVKHIVVCGHYNCGGVLAAMQAEDMGILNPWLRNVRDVFRLHKEELNEIKNKTKQYNRLVELNVQEQCVNVLKTASVQRAYKQRGIMVHGWVFDIHTGKIIDLKLDFEHILEEIMEIYKLD